MRLETFRLNPEPKLAHGSGLGAGQAPRHCSGQATLSFILLVSGVVLEVAVAGSFITYFLNSAGFGERLSARALAAAQAGVGDATLQVVRNKEFVTAGTATYTLRWGAIPLRSQSHAPPTAPQIPTSIPLP